MYLNKIEFFTVVLCNLFALCNLLDYCSPEYCNFAGDCSLIANKPNCQCYTESFYGQYCEKVKDLCETEQNPCPIRNNCLPYIGQMVCDYKEPNIKLITPTKPLCSYNIRSVYGTKHYFVLSFEQVDTLKLDITFSTSTYLIAHVNSTVESNYTRNLTTTLDKLGIRRHITIPYATARYYLFETVLPTPGVNQLTIEIKSYNKINSYKQTMSHLLHVSPPRNICLPKIVFQYGMDPKYPQVVDVEHFTNLQATVEKRCSPTENTFQTQWTVFNFDETITFFSTSIGKELLLKIPQYTLWYEAILKLYPETFFSVRMAFKECNTPWTYTRCYLWVTARNIIANIAGGHLREVNPAKWIILDGTSSRDPAQRPELPQQLTYTWLLSSENGSNEEYLAFRSKHARLQLPANTLNMGVISRITLIATSRLSQSRSNTATQLIRAVNDTLPISLDIKCIRNCQSNIYDVDTVLHLFAICFKCRLPIKYTWIMNGVDMQQNKPRFLTKLDTSFPSDILVQLNVSDRSGKGYAELKLQKSEPLNIGECIIEPKFGIECITRFHVRCGAAKLKLEKPLLYSFKLGQICAETNNFGEAFLYLNCNDSLTVHICSFPAACVLRKVHFTVTPVPASDWKRLHSNPIRMFEEGRRQQGFCVLNKMANNSIMNINLNYTEAMNYDQASTLLELVNTLENVQSLMSNAASVNSTNAYVLTYLLERVVYCFDFIRNDQEILDMTEKMLHKLATLLTDIISYSMSKVEQQEELLTPSEFSDPFNEVHKDWLPFNSNYMLYDISRCSKILNLIFKIWYMIGEQLTRYIHPEESYSYITKQVSYKVKMIENLEPIHYTSTDQLCSFEVPLSTVKYLQNQLKSSELMLQIWYFRSNIYWWPSENWTPTSSILAVNIFGKNGQYANELITSANTYKLSLLRDETNWQNVTTKTEVFQQALIIYKVKLPDYVNLFIDFSNTTKSLNILITMNSKPTWNNIAHTNCRISEGQRKTCILRNHCSHQSIAYIAIYKENPLDSTSVVYNYRLTAVECGVWQFHENNPHWIRKYCYLHSVKQNPLYFDFTVQQLAAFSFKEYPIYPFSIERYEYSNKLPLNWHCLLFYILLILGVIVLLLLAKKHLYSRRNELIRVINTNRDEVKPETENIIVYLHTGGMQLAETTATIKLEFKSDLGKYKVFIYQNPLYPQLGVNNSCILRLSDQYIQLPCRITISHDNSGRYPSWYCRSLQVNDLRQNLSYTFPIDTWIKQNQKIRVSCYPLDLEQRELNNNVGHWERLNVKIRYYVEINFINWFMFQPILGPSQYSENSCNIYERICIWTCKTMLAVTLVYCYFGNATNYYNYDEFERGSSFLNLSEFLTLAFGSYVITVLFQLILTRITNLKSIK